jgi:hypothetical protein
MKKLVTLLFLLISFVTYSQSGVGYLNYTVYNIINNGAGAYANNATDFVNMFDVTKGATVYASGTAAVNSALLDFNDRWTASGIPNGGNYTGIKIYGYFVPKETGTYSFFINGDDGVDFSLDGSVVTSFYGPHGFGTNHYGTVNLVAGKSYAFMARYQNWGGGWGMDLEWKRPSQSNWSIQSDECYSTQPSTPTKKAITNFNFNTNVDATKFSLGSALSSNGTADITSLLDSNKVNTGYKATITAGQVEWSYTNPNASWLNGNSRLLIDMRQVGNIDPTTINSVKIFDAYDGPVTFSSNDGTWAIYTVPSPLTKITDGTSANNSSIRNVNGWNTDYAFQSTIAFSATQAYKTQKISLTTTNNLATLYNSIVTVSDVWLAFKEVANVGIFGNQSGNEFVYGIQYQNGDVNNDGYFNEADAFLLLQHLTGKKNIVDTFKLNNTLRIIPQSTYDSIGKSNWTAFTNPLDSNYSFDINTGKSTDTLNLAMAWKGDVNLSHSTTPKSNGITTMSVRTTAVSTDVQSSIITELANGKVYAYITFDPLQQNVVGTQFQLNYDNSVLKFEGVEFKTKGSPMNYGTDKGTFVNLGSLITDGSTSLDNTTEYKVIFTPTRGITNTLGLLAIGSTDAVNKDGKQLKLKVN